MRCPKCHYLGFDPEPRCKNCGYDLDIEADDSELALQVVDREPSPEQDLPLRVVRPVQPPAPEPALVGAGAPLPVRRVAARAPHTTTELPLFVKNMAAMEPSALVLDRAIEPEPERQPEAERAPEPAPEHVPEIALPPASRPLSVRRPAPEPPRTPAPRIERRVGPIDHDLLDDLRRLDREAARRPIVPEPIADEPVAVSVRLSAAALDGLLLGGIGAFVLWATLKLCNAAPADLTAAALFPMGIFLAGVGVAYLLMFTAADGQTVGKMLMGIRVVADSNTGDGHVTIGQAAGRALLAPLSVAVLGLGWVPAFFGRGLALHDRLVHTRVVRA